MTFLVGFLGFKFSFLSLTSKTHTMFKKLNTHRIVLFLVQAHKTDDLQLSRY